MHANPFVDLYSCVANQHRPDMILLALAATILAGATTVLALRRARRERGVNRYVWGSFAGTALGAGAWAAHHVALLGYLAGAPATFIFDLTLISLIQIILSGVTATTLLLRFPTRGGLATASLFYGGGLAVMHYTGMAAIGVPATMHWIPAFVAASVVIAIVLSYPMLALAFFPRRRIARIGAIGCFSLLVILTHMTGMTALELVPGRTMARGLVISPGNLAAWIGVVKLGLFSTGLLVLLANRQTRAALERSERQFSILVKNTSDYAICMLDREGRISQWNAGARQLTGYEAGQVIGMSMACLFTVEDRAEGLPAQALDTAAIKGICKGLWICRRRDGTHFWADSTMEKVCDEQGVHTGFSLITHDVTQIREAQTLVAETSQRLDTALENMHEGLCLFDDDDRVVLCNWRFRELWNLDASNCAPGTALGQLIVAGFMNPDGPACADGHLRQFRHILDNTLAEQNSAPVVVELGENRVVSIANSPLPEGGWVTTCTDITEQRRSEAKIEYMALHDSLTGLPNRTGYYRRLDHEIEQAAQHGAQVAVIAIDLDRFKEINDTYGHAAGDGVLQTIAERLMASNREGEAIARLGGDEFAAAKSFSDQRELREFILRVQKCIVSPMEDGGQRLSVGASLGIALYPQDAATREALLNNADLAMYRAKSTVGQTVCFFEPSMDESARARRQLANDLRHAISRGELRLLYQPQRSLKTGALSGYEALLRWHHAKRGVVPPDEFIPLAEETGEIFTIGEWVLQQACMEARRWPVEQKVAVNLSPVQFLQPGLVERVRAILIETGLSPRRLELEITETAIITDKLRALHCLRQIKAMGVSVAIDDFGTGYSSLDTLHSFPFDKIKIDKSFLSQAESSGQARAIIRAVLALGKSLDIPVLAEGVETESQLLVLQSEGCDEAQGYYFGRPAAAPSLDMDNAVNS
ncbi:EAL domain-containing protein [Novosphingobium sp. CF614]|uniref:bifunctional diguanylate cyclase/phosphodiesterase n=1 Tax=Novosphingobium sp. CF614 TaxID=1884364 RepID=UPI002101CE4D|nr:EAL domain-containing protein [Novosphingobium sp. CF614]